MRRRSPLIRDRHRRTDALREQIVDLRTDAHRPTHGSARAKRSLVSAVIDGSARGRPQPRSCDGRFSAAPTQPPRRRPCQSQPLLFSPLPSAFKYFLQDVALAWSRTHLTLLAHRPRNLLSENLPQIRARCKRLLAAPPAWRSVYAPIRTPAAATPSTPPGRADAARAALPSRRPTLSSFRSNLISSC